jgi:hypothetical protein
LGYLLPVLCSVALGASTAANANGVEGIYIGAAVGAGTNLFSSVSKSNSSTKDTDKKTMDGTYNAAQMETTFALPLMFVAGYRLNIDNFVMLFEGSVGWTFLGNMTVGSEGDKPTKGTGTGNGGYDTAQAGGQPAAGKLTIGQSFLASLNFMPGAKVSDMLSIHALVGATVMRTKNTLKAYPGAITDPAQITPKENTSTSWLIGANLGLAAEIAINSAFHIGVRAYNTYFFNGGGMMKFEKEGADGFRGYAKGDEISGSINAQTLMVVATFAPMA